MRYYLVAIKQKKSLLDKLLNRTIVEGFDFVDCVLFSRLNYHPDTKHVVYPLWSNKDKELVENVIKQMDKFIWGYQQQHKGKLPTMIMVKRELYKNLRKKGHAIKEHPTYFDIKMELTDEE